MSTTIKTFSRRAEAIDYLAAGLSGWGLDDEAGAALAAALADTLVTFSSESPTEGFGLVLGRFAIRDDDLAVLDAAKSAVLAAAPTNFFFNAPTTASLAGLLAAMCVLVRQIHRKGCRLDPIQRHILLCLKAAGRRLTTEELTAILNRDSGQAGHWTTEAVEVELARLSAVPLRDGSVVSLVSRDADGTWAPAGV